ncbi:MAG: endo-1,4-beta-xylanase [Phycisphaerae bacterium]|nr:endo-1,4-beta-xylanase [Phycisphaerae bacterium]
MNTRNTNSKTLAAQFLFCWLAGLALTNIVHGQNLLTNPGFEYGDKSGWVHYGCDMRATRDQAQSGNYSAYIYNRTESWQGPRQSVLGKLEDGKTYRISAWVRLDNTESDSVGLTVYQEDAAGTIYPHPQWTTGYRDRWVHLSGGFTLNATGSITGLDIYVEGPGPGVNFYVDDLSVEEVGDWRAEVRERTEQVRKRDVALTVLGPDARPAAGAQVRIRQIRNHFAFGSTINKLLLESGGNNRYAEFVRNHYEWAVFENEARWGNTERIQGQVSYADADAMYAWCRDHGITLRGHPMYWAVEQFVPSWVKALSTAGLRAAVENRMERAMSHFKDKFVHWDINNEMVTGHYYKDRLGEDIRLWMFQRAHEIDPDCQLFVNDYNIIAWGDNLDAYIQLILWLLDNGAPVHGIGVQSHFDAGFDPVGVLDRLGQIASLGLPVWVSEFDMAAPNEHIRADNLEDFYRIAFSHPAVHGITMWGFWENSHWRENCYIVNADWSLNEAGRRYEALRAEWRTETEGVTDASGTARFRGFHGTYEITVSFSDSSAMTTTFDLLPASTPLAMQIDHAGNIIPADTAGDDPVGTVGDDFETGDFSSFPWESSGDASWRTTRQERHSGSYGAESGSIEDGESTALQVILSCVSGDITFCRKVSSESGFDYLEFYIDGVEQDDWSGEEDWAEVSFPVTAGTRTFEWVYSKDSSASEGDDTAWIDDIVFPLMSTSDGGGSLPLTASVEITAWQGNKRGACSFTFDDNLKTHLSHFVPKFEDLGFVGTVFLITNDGDLSIVNDSYFQYAGLVDSGWEIGSHAVSHSNLIELDNSSLRSELADSRATLQALFDLPSGLTLSYPFAASDPRVRNMTAQYYIAARGGQPTTISPDMSEWPLEGYDEFNLPSYAWATSDHDLGAMNSATNRAISRGEWIVEMIHGTDGDGWEPPDWTSVYEPHFEYVKRRESDLWIDTFGNVYRYIAERDACRVSVQALTGGTAIVLTNESALPATPVPLTIKIDIPDQWISVTVADNGSVLSGRIITENQNKYYLVDTVPADAPKELYVSGNI